MRKELARGSCTDMTKVKLFVQPLQLSMIVVWAQESRNLFGVFVEEEKLLYEKLQKKEKTQKEQKRIYIEFTLVDLRIIFEWIAQRMYEGKPFSKEEKVFMKILNRKRNYLRKRKNNSSSEKKSS